MNLKTGCWLGSAIGLVLLLFLAWRVTHVPRIGEDFSKLPRQVQEERRASVQQLQNEVQDIGNAARNKEHKPFTLVTTEDQLNTLLQDNLRTGNFVIRDLRAGLTPGEIALQGRIIYKGFDTVSTARGDIVLEGGQLRCNVKSLQVGGLPAPSSWKEKLEQPITKFLNEQLVKAPGQLSRVEIGDKTLTIEGVTD